MAGRASRSGRRRFLVGAVGLGLSAAGAGVLAAGRGPTTGPPDLNGELETSRLRVIQTPSVCTSPQFLAQGLLRSEGFTDLEYVKTTTTTSGPALASGRADITMQFAATLITQIDAGDPIVILGGAHVGCFELFGTNGVRAIRDLKGRTVAVQDLGGPGHLYVASLLAHVGLDPRLDVTWV